MDKSERKALESLLAKYEREYAKLPLLIDAIRIKSTGNGGPTKETEIRHDTFYGKSIIEAAKDVFNDGRQTRTPHQRNYGSAKKRVGAL